MQFIPDGPDIPESLLQAHEEGELVFFCGAGISRPAGLPMFKGLVEDIYNKLALEMYPVEKEAFDVGHYDRTLELLERRLEYAAPEMRKALEGLLQPKWHRKGARQTHEALIRLASDRHGETRLVTTNFDRIFCRVCKSTKRKITHYAAPMLPIPKKSHWNGIVYLHGLLPQKSSEVALRKLIVTSGDFGLAYLTERWASRFVGELFRNYSICFVGYSIEDPVLRYMMDALAVDGRRGESTMPAYAFAEIDSGDKDTVQQKWKAKGVDPILYRPEGGHAKLHQTLDKWSETWSDGTLGKERIVISHAMAHPSTSTQQDDFVGRMLWAISDPSSIPAQRFAEFNPVPSLDWLEIFDEKRFETPDLVRFGIAPHPKAPKRSFSLVRRPLPYQNAADMSLVSKGQSDAVGDDVMAQIARWLLRHLNDPKLIMWVAQNGGRLNEHFAFLIDRQLEEIEKLESKENSTELNDLLAQAPNAIPDKRTRKIWRAIINGHAQEHENDSSLYLWCERVEREGLSVSLRLRLRELLAPRIKIETSLYKGFATAPGTDPVWISPSLMAERVRSSMRDRDKWRKYLIPLFDDFKLLLKDLLDLLQDLSTNGESYDRSFSHLPSISPHHQNNLGQRDWTVLIELLRDAWLELNKQAPVDAARHAREWMDSPHLSFKRLAFFAATQNSYIKPNEWVMWLIDDNAHWLWQWEVRREVLRLLVLRGPQLTKVAKSKLESVIRRGPPIAAVTDGKNQEQIKLQADRSVWLRLVKLQSVTTLAKSTSRLLNRISREHPQWKLAENQSDEFLHWTTSFSWESEDGSGHGAAACPDKKSDIIVWLNKLEQSNREMFQVDNWSEACKKHPVQTGCALVELANQGVWYGARWSSAFFAWSKGAMAKRSWRYLAPVLSKMPDKALSQMLSGLVWWLECVASTIKTHLDIFFNLCDRVLQLQVGSKENHDGVKSSVSSAIDDPVGHVTEALIDLCFSRKPSDGDGLPTDIKPFFNRLSDTDIPIFRHGRVILASRLIALYRIDRDWTEKRLLPVLDWERNHLEALAAWDGFMRAPRLYVPLLLAIKEPLLATAKHYDEFGDFAEQYAYFMTYAAVDGLDGFTNEDFRTVFQQLPTQGINAVAEALVQALKGAGDNREEYWSKRIFSFWNNIFPKDKIARSESLAILTIEARDRFPQAFATLKAYIYPASSLIHVTHNLYKSGLCERYPKEALELLDKLHAEQRWIQPELRKCLNQIIQSDRSLSRDLKYMRLDDLAKRRGY